MTGRRKRCRRSSSCGLARVVRSCDLLQTGLHAPNLSGVFRNSAVAGELAAAGDVVDDHLGPLFRILLTPESHGDQQNIYIYIQ